MWGKRRTTPGRDKNKDHYYQGVNEAISSVVQDFNHSTSVPVLTGLLNNCIMTIVRTIEANKISEMTDGQLRTGVICIPLDKGETPVSYITKTPKTIEKLVLMLSSVHTQAILGYSDKPEVTDFYNATKVVFDIFEPVCTSLQLRQDHGKR